MQRVPSTSSCFISTCACSPHLQRWFPRILSTENSWDAQYITITKVMQCLSWGWQPAYVFKNRATRLASSLQGVSNAYRGRLLIGNIRRVRKFVMFVQYQLVLLSNCTVLIPSKWRFSWFSRNICTSGFPLNKNTFPTYILHKKPTWHWHVFAAYTPWN